MSSRRAGADASLQWVRDCAVPRFAADPSSTKTRGPITTYSREFKLRAMQRVATLIQQQGQRGPIAQVARELGLDEKLLVRWRREYDADPQNPFPAS